jgi:hypothetical protein
MGTKQVKLKPIQPLNTENFAELMRKFGARPAEVDSVSYVASDDGVNLASTSVSDNTTPPENRIPPENRAPENRAPENEPACMIRIIGFTAFGVLAALKDYFYQGNGTINILQFAYLHGISRSALTVQLRILEQNGLIQLGPPERRGRSIRICCIDNGKWCPVFRALPENKTRSSSSSNNNNNNNKQLLLLPKDNYSENRAPENRAPGNRAPENRASENRAPENRASENRAPENRVSDFSTDELALIAPVPEYLYPEENNVDKLPYLPSWEKAQMRDQAEELFYIGLTAKVDPEEFSMQTLVLYSKIVKERGKDWAAALFLILLPKAKDNPTGYITSAYRNGAEPTSASIMRVRDMWEPLEKVGKVLKSQLLKDRLHEAIENEDAKAIISLTQAQTSTKLAMRMLSWTATLDELLKRRDVFIDSLFGLD